jgi:hypothetical protein
LADCQSQLFFSGASATWMAGTTLRPQPGNEKIRRCEAAVEAFGNGGKGRLETGTIEIYCA